MKIETIEVSGFASALKAVRLPYNKEAKSDIDTHVKSGILGTLRYGSIISVAQEDIELLKRLESSGDEHAKPLRGILAYVDITAPINFWWDLETYNVGHQRLFSGSTMHTEGKGLKGKALQKALHEIPFDRPIRKIDYFSYQTLRRIVSQRYNHRKPEFHEFIEWVKTLPYADELILLGLEDKLAVHEQMYNEYLSEE